MKIKSASYVDINKLYLIGKRKGNFNIPRTQEVIKYEYVVNKKFIREIHMCLESQAQK